MLNEQQLEDLCIGWFQETGWRFVHGPDIAPDGANPERADYRQVILRDRLLAALARINPHIPTAALDQAVHMVQTISEPQPVVRNLDQTLLDQLNALGYSIKREDHSGLMWQSWS